MMERLVPVTMNHKDLLAILDELRERVADGDSFEGGFQYMIPEDADADPRSFDVLASYRIGNTMGQGGTRIIGRWADTTPETVDTSRSVPGNDWTPWQIARDDAEDSGTWPEPWGPFHRHFANDAIHRDGGPECDQPGTPRRVYVFDPDYLNEHEMAVAQWAIQHPDQFTDSDGNT